MSQAAKNKFPKKKKKEERKEETQIVLLTSLYELVGFEETVSKDNGFLSVQKILQREFESNNLPPIKLKCFDGNPELCPEFIENC